ncbi:hypothetical protein E2562_009730 [Oryza meyeriana var. granulata]|uniref:Uncharacterized protein n=1 Tax=Oryza meyeriana var. granulata TaxID=110450 RepID=A0A6G1D0G7_9ORYZ|nr:hypothetical protein E2562_009730 [Oryza meyeriana var. granulata]
MDAATAAWTPPPGRRRIPPPGPAQRGPWSSSSEPPCPCGRCAALWTASTEPLECRPRRRRRCMIKTRSNKLSFGFIDSTCVNKTYVANFVNVVDYLARTLILHKSKSDIVLLPYCAN